MAPITNCERSFSLRIARHKNEFYPRNIVIKYCNFDTSNHRIHKKNIDINVLTSLSMYLSANTFFFFILRLWSSNPLKLILYPYFLFPGRKCSQ